MQLEKLAHHSKSLWQKSRCALVVLPAIFWLEGCETFANLVEVQKPIAKLSYLNPPRPNPVLPPKIEVGPTAYWTAKNVQKNTLLCMQSDHYLSLRVFNREIAFWMKQANSALNYHEKMNGIDDGKDKTNR
jgi:hypothetical protein